MVRWGSINDAVASAMERRSPLCVRASVLGAGAQRWLTRYELLHGRAASGVSTREHQSRTAWPNGLKNDSRVPPFARFGRAEAALPLLSHHAADEHVHAPLPCCMVEPASNRTSYADGLFGFAPLLYPILLYREVRPWSTCIREGGV